MVARKDNPNLAKINHSYTVAEIAGLYGAHRNTVRRWIKDGLRVCDDRRPTLILGEHLRDFLRQRRQARKRPCGADELYCARCRAPRRPAGGMVDYEPTTTTRGRLIALCPVCSAMMNRYAGRATLARIRSVLDVSIPKKLERISDSNGLPVNSDFE